MHRNTQRGRSKLRTGEFTNLVPGSTAEEPGLQNALLLFFRMSTDPFDKLLLHVSSSLLSGKSERTRDYVLSGPITVLDVTSLHIDATCSQDFLGGARQATAVSP